jgi:Xaa-Pro aminopeptidase
MSIHADVKNGGEAALANLETAQRIVASPTLLAQFKKDAELAKKSKVRAVAWLRDLRTEKEAQAAATSVRYRTRFIPFHSSSSVFYSDLP